MNQEGSEDTERPEIGSDPSQGAEETPAGALDATRGMDLAGLLGGLLGSGDETAGEGDASGSRPDTGFGGLLGALMGGGDAFNLDGLATDSGVSPSAISAVVPLIAGALLGQGHEAGVTRAALDDVAQGRASAADALGGTGLLQEIMRRTGLNQAGALAVITAVLKALGMGKIAASAHSKPKPKPKPSARPKPRPKPSASAAAKPKPRPKPSSHAASSAKPKPKPKPSSHTTSARPKPKPKPRPKRTGEAGLGGEGSAEESSA